MKIAEKAKAPILPVHVDGAEIGKGRLRRGFQTPEAPAPEYGPLYKQYAALCEPGGVRFLDFSIRVDGLVVVDLACLTKRRRYIGGEFLQA